MASAIAALFFARYYRDSRDSLFLFFAAAFAIESVNRTLLAFSPTPNEAAQALYLLRILSYVLILLGIVSKNRA
jgi:hypothetical protein